MGSARLPAPLLRESAVEAPAARLSAVAEPAQRGLAGWSVLVVGIYYRPEQTGIAPYTTAVAEHLASVGADVRALTGIPHYPAWRVFDGYGGKIRSSERLSGVNVRRLKVHVPARQSASHRALYEASYAVQATLSGGNSPDVVLGVVPTLAGGFGAAVHAARSRAPLGLIVQDLSGPAALQSGIPGGGGMVAGVTRRLEAGILRRADRIAIVSEGFRGYIEDAGVDPARIAPLPNWSRMPEPNASPKEAREELGWPADSPIALHAGNMGLKQGLEHLVAAARLGKALRPDLKFVLMGDGSQRAALERSAEGLDNLIFTGSRHGSEFANALGAADVLLVNERASVLDMSLPSKLTSYFLARRPVLAAVAPPGVTAAEIERSGGGIVVPAEDPRALLRAIDDLLANPALRLRLAAAGRAYADEHLTAAAGLARAERFVADLGELGENGTTRAVERRGAVAR